MLSEAQIEAELGNLLKVDITAPRWAESCLLDLEYVQRTAERLKLAPSDSRYAIGVAILQAINDCAIPTGPHSPIDAWREVVAAELNFLGAIRKTTIAVLAARHENASSRAIVDAISGDKFSPAKLNASDLSTLARQQAVTAALRNFRLWKSWDVQALTEDDGWKPIIIALSQPGALSRDIIYESRDQLRHKVALFLHSNKTPSFSPKFFETWRLQPTEGQPVQPTLEPSTSEPAPITEANYPANGIASEQASRPVNEQDLPLNNFVVIDWWVKERFRQAASAGDDTGLIDKARRLAEYLAAIQLQIETGPEPTPRLVLRNMQRALRGIGIEPGRDNIGDSLIGLLQRTQILAAIDNRWEFTNPNLVDYFGARYISEYGQHWVSLRPKHRRLMLWAAACLARRGDDERTRLFVADLGRALSHASELSWLEVADLLVEFPRDQSPAICELREQLGQAFRRLAAIKSNRLRCCVAEKSSRLGLELGLASFDESIEEVIPATDLDRSVNEVGLGTLLQMLGVTKFLEPDSNLVEDVEVIRILVSHLQKRGDELKRPCAAWLRRSSLQTVTLTVNLKALWKSRPESALEAIAKIATNEGMDAYTQTLARSILTKDDFIVRLWELNEACQPLVYTLLLALDKRLLVTARAEQWLVVE